MPSPFSGLFERLRPKQYGRKQPLLLINGLAEQQESWYRNRKFWGRYFDVFAPNILAYEGEALHRKIAAKEPARRQTAVIQGQLPGCKKEFLHLNNWHVTGDRLGRRRQFDRNRSVPYAAATGKDGSVRPRRAA